ncbi:MAG: HAD family phosphatase [Muribaculaceae bacterium]|nr:HAD family phosphatase [Muribaculaceae bacterium]
MIRNLLFDLGGVIMDIERRNCVAAFDALGLPDADSFFGEYSQKGPFMLLEEGAISVDEFHNRMRAEFPHEVTDSQIDEAFLKFLTGIPVHRLEALRRLREHFGIYLLSNTNVIMWQSKIADEFTKEGRVREDYFDGMVTSFDAKALKPAPEIFIYAEKTLGIKPEETLFIDDSQRNLDAAAALGFNTLLVKPGEEFTEKIAACLER